ncbi:TetR/AcrR family transcriptional regulator [Pseudomonas sp. MWU16-30317]|uniref:TetR/AcrR family transcriptional regulator n=1 Tax=Pseudomonas sp. MWU16-30317 TaxID=2878095 RepID=UPI001CFB4521|nr:TetR/AcrR family transcriptional regulator [Pseudomonas sp. MWU16-30317]
MRYSADHKAQTHERIVKEAAARFRKDGIGATGLQPLMKALGLTHGGFYAHFKSKDDLVETALRSASEEMGTLVAAKFAGDKPLEGFIDMYLSDAHRDHPERGCPLPTMAAEMGQRGQPSPLVDRAVQHRAGLMAQALGDGEDAEAQSLVMLSTLIGALVLSRSVEDQDFAARILATAREALKRQARPGADIP